MQSTRAVEAETFVVVWLIDDALVQLRHARDAGSEADARARVLTASRLFHGASRLAPAGSRLPLQHLVRLLRLQLYRARAVRPAALDDVAARAAEIRFALEADPLRMTG